MGHRLAAVRSDSSAHGFNVNNPLVTSTFSAVFIRGCSQTRLSKAYYCKGFCARRNAAALSNDLASTAGGTRQNATRWDKTQSAPQSFAEETQTNETCKTDEEKSGETHRAIRGCQSVKMQISWHANGRRRMRECASSSMLGGCNYITATGKGKATQYVRPQVK